MGIGAITSVGRAAGSPQFAHTRPQVALVPRERRLRALPQPPSAARGEWPVDHARARYDAQRALEAIDFSKPVIALWVPGTSNHEISPSFARAARARWTPGQLSLSLVDYEASWRMRHSVSTGIETLRLVIEGIRKRGGRHTVVLAGESQGAWVIGEAMTDSRVRQLVTRAVLFGHPALASTHHHGQPGDGKVVEIHHADDHVAMPLRGDVTTALEGMEALYRRRVGKLGSLVSAVADNPVHGALMLKGVARWFSGGGRDPHDYRADMQHGVALLAA